MVREVGDWLLVALTVAMCVFTLIYGFRSRWWTNVVGRIFFPEKVVMCLVLTQVSLSAVTGSNYLGRDWVRLTLYGLGALSLVGMTVVLVWIQQRERRRASEEVSDDVP